MPIRMVDDEQPRKPKQTSGKGGSNPLLTLLPMLIGFIIKRPKLLVPILLLGGGVYLFRGSLFPTGQIEEQLSLAMGLVSSPEVYEESNIYEPLAADYKNDLPTEVSLRAYCPKIRNQGSQGSCVGWSSSYAARTILEARATGARPDAVAFSPSSLYNQIKLPNCQGAYIHQAMETMQQNGVLPWSDFAYNEHDCDRLPNRELMGKMAGFRSRGFERLSDKYGKMNLNAIKENLAQGAPVVIGMMVGQSFMQPMMGKNMWNPSQSDYSMRGMGGHAMCVIGYNDNYEGGAFEIMNSWGPQWGEDGYGWVRYNDFVHFTKEAYGLHPMGETEKLDPEKFSADFGLVENETKSMIPLKQIAYGVFETTQAVKKGTRFKIEFKNSIECYTYILGEETDGSSYVLFPYTEKHSPYFGITGTRLFPRQQSLMADEAGTRDRMLVLVSKKPLNPLDIRDKMNASAGNFLQKVNAAVGEQLIEGVEFRPGDLIHFDARTAEKSIVGMILEVRKN